MNSSANPLLGGAGAYYLLSLMEQNNNIDWKARAEIAWSEITNTENEWGSFLHSQMIARNKYNIPNKYEDLLEQSLMHDLLAEQNGKAYTNFDFRKGAYVKTLEPIFNSNGSISFKMIIDLHDTNEKIKQRNIQLAQQNMPLHTTFDSLLTSKTYEEQSKYFTKFIQENVPDFDKLFNKLLNSNKTSQDAQTFSNDLETMWKQYLGTLYKNDPGLNQAIMKIISGYGREYNINYTQAAGGKMSKTGVRNLDPASQAGGAYDYLYMNKIPLDNKASLVSGKDIYYYNPGTWQIHSFIAQSIAQAFAEVFQINITKSPKGNKIDATNTTYTPDKGKKFISSVNEVMALRMASYKIQKSYASLISLNVQKRTVSARGLSSISSIGTSDFWKDSDYNSIVGDPVAMYQMLYTATSKPVKALAIQLK